MNRASLVVCRYGPAFPAFSPTKTTAVSSGSKPINSLTHPTPSRSSWPDTARVPFHHGITFQVTVSLRGIPACCMNRKVASAVESSLLRLMKPDPARFVVPATTVMGPGFSNRKSILALAPHLADRIQEPRRSRVRATWLHRPSEALCAGDQGSPCGAPGPQDRASSAAGHRNRVYGPCMTLVSEDWTLSQQQQHVVKS